MSANTQQQGVSTRSGDRLTATRCCDKCLVLPEQLPRSRAQLLGRGGHSAPPPSPPQLQLAPGCSTPLPPPSRYLFMKPESLWLQLLLLPPLILSESLRGRRCSCVLLPAHPELLLPFVPPPLERFPPGPPLPQCPLCRVGLRDVSGSSAGLRKPGHSPGGAGADPGRRPSAFLSHFRGA